MNKQKCWIWRKILLETQLEKPTLNAWVHKSQVQLSPFALYSHFQPIIVKKNVIRTMFYCICISNMVTLHVTIFTDSPISLHRERFRDRFLSRETAVFFTLGSPTCSIFRVCCRPFSFWTTVCATDIGICFEGHIL